MVDLRAFRDVLGLAAALALALGSAVSVVLAVHESRLLVNELQGLQRERDRLQVEWGQLLLEKSTWGSYARVETTAGQELDMYLPSVREIVVVTP